MQPGLCCYRLDLQTAICLSGPPPALRGLYLDAAKLLRDEAESMVPNIDPEQVRKLAGWGLTQNDRASFVGWRPQPSAVGPVLISLGF